MRLCPICKGKFPEEYKGERKVEYCEDCKLIADEMLEAYMER